MSLLQLFLLPFSWVYGLIMVVRNSCFNWNWLPSRKFSIPIISVGNLSFGGTGKTPHIEYLIKLLQDEYQIATLSRGYGRTSKGFVLASKRSAYKYVGDEPLQYAKKFEKIKVAVDEERVRGIQTLMEKYPKLEAILLDDAFQHRHVHPGLSILLTSFHKLYTDNFVFPSGTLREFSSGAKRADIIIVTKTPSVLSPITRRRIINELKPASHQEVFFSYIRYGNPIPVSPEQQKDPYQTSVILLFTGIANDYPLKEHLSRKCRELEVMKFHDHHPYKLEDLRKIKTRFDDIPTKKKVIFTTEKDMMRLKTPELSNFVRHLPLYYLPIEVVFHGNDRQKFDQIIRTYVEKNPRNS
jgi:tetraacyldisaccharide 4'-kinase